MGGVSIHSPDMFWTWRPGWGEAWRSCNTGQAWRIPRGAAEISYEYEEATVAVRTDALVGERPIVGWVLDNLKVRVGTG